MSWAAVAAAGGALISGIAASKKAKSDRAAAKEDAKELTEEGTRFNAILSQFNAEQDYYYEQLQRKNKQRGLDQFRQFSTVNQFAPNFIGGNNTIALPEKPDINKLITANTPAPAATNSSGGGSKTSNTSLKGMIVNDAKGELAKLIPGHLGKILGL